MATKTDNLDAHERAAKTLYPADPGEMYGYDIAQAVITRRGDELYTHTGLDEAARKALGDTHIAIRRATGLPEGIREAIAEAHVDALLADTRAVSDTEADADETTVAKRIADGNAEVREDFIARYGKKDGPALLDRTAAFVRSHPALATILQQRGLGSRPDIVKGIAAHVFSTGWRPPSKG